MTTLRKISLVILAVTAVSLCIQPCQGQEEQTRGRHGAFRTEKGSRELTSEVIAKTIEHVRQADPERAEELERLQKADPEKFESEIRKIFRDRMRKKAGRRGKYDSDKMGRLDGPGDDKVGRGRHGESGIRDRDRDRDRKGRGRGGDDTEYITWLNENYPEKAKEMAELQKDKPGLYNKCMTMSRGRYGEIFKASKDNPRLCEILKEDLVLKDQRDDLLKKINAETDGAGKEALLDDLKTVVGKRFDLLVERKQMRYEHLKKRLEKLQKEVKDREAELDKLKDKKQEQVKERIDVLVKKTETIKWD